ncbi:PAS domain-containing protein [Sphingomonas montanisoli]|uniref:histidine kinase n=1 Tax=Sphingomonas montanisoli TaxID=2606412 RepID=A0A5D9C8U1_9SPHN|nr:PAS domain-containing protein [Sphingomonas montanisoli]TZG28109.1 PAS domain-containing protein [Sphingomonas montanisoli]
MAASTPLSDGHFDWHSDGTAAALLDAIDWTGHTLGPPEAWPPSLRMMVRNMLASPEAMFLLWGEPPILFFNDACLPVIGPRAREGMGMRFDTVWAKAFPQLAPLYRRALGGQAIRVVDVHMPLARGDAPVDTWWTFSYSPVHDVDDVIRGVTCIATETTEHVLRDRAGRIASAALAQTEEGLRRAQQAGRIGLFTIDIATNELRGTPEFFRLFGLPAAAVIPASMIEALVIPADGDKISGASERGDGSADLHVEYRIRRPDNGTIRCIERRGEFENDETGRPFRFLGVVQDVTERRAAQDALAALNATLEARVRERTEERNLIARIIEETDSLVNIIGPDYRWLGINRAAANEFEAIYGARPEVGDPILDLIDDPTERENIQAMWARALSGEEFLMVAAFGDPNFVAEQRTYEMRFNVLRDTDGHTLGAYQMGTDISERVRAEAEMAQMHEALRQSQKMEAMGQLTGGVAHDFNNLLTPIMGSLDLLQRKAGMGTREMRLIDGALQSAERAKMLVQRLLAFARRQPLQPSPVDMAALVGGMTELLVSTCGPQIRLATELAPDLPPALVDPNQLEMAILNLCVNARDAMPEGGVLTITTGIVDRNGPHVRLSVIDTGVGMDAETAARSIEPFYSTKGIGKGTGLGLSMVHGLALQLGGAMTIETAPGEGTRIDLWLPASDILPTATPDVTARATETAFSGRALVVDDEAVVRMTTVHMLQSLGYETQEAADAQMALAMLETDAGFDLIVTDHLMPGLSGAEFAALIRARWPAMPVLIISGYADVDGIAPDIPRLSKPFREADLAEALAGLR